MPSPSTVPTEIRPAPFIVESPNLNQNNLVLLHGTSSWGVPFAQELMALVHFDALLPYTKLTFPSGILRKTTVFGGNLTNAWFDIADFSDRTIGEEQQKEGLRDSLEYLGKLIKDVVDNESHEDRKIFVGGLSQGCAMSVILLLSGELDRLEVLQKIGGFVGFSGWLPFSKQIAEVAAAGKDWRQRRILVQSWLRRELSLTSLQFRDDMTISTEGDMRILLAHGTNDTKVKLEWGEDMRRVLESVGYSVEWKLYEALGHVIIPEELAYMASFIRKELPG
ncbi:uncharacterized protein EAE97_007280 [Botrytis byssoidea]|uniref:Phospholipase/carboxylesterase/thioesterase domain-containing protein n=1 Tax=Botrytis byssoidea TaxID=139641 RepID=A0A9P5ILI5_9HELO|nr:uncharacterized protein EAE97_007280 [Botrytis byssoidea]KAF7939200.1 hypothetical protein EAE97_007280 [Botrytis byssoidea]